MKKEFCLFFTLILLATCFAGCQRGSPDSTIPEVQNVAPLVTVTENDHENTTTSEPLPLEQEISPTPKPVPTPEPTPTQTPAPDPTPQPTEEPIFKFDTHTSNLMQITKNPGDENVTAGGHALFISYADGAIRTEWYFLNQSKTEEMKWNDENLSVEFPTLICSNGDSNTLSLQNIPEALNGWSVFCLFIDDEGNAMASNEAFISVSLH